MFPYSQLLSLLLQELLKEAFNSHIQSHRDPSRPPPCSNTIPHSQNLSFSLSSPNPKFHTFISFIRHRSKREREREREKGCYQQETNTVLLDSMVARTNVSGGGEGRNGTFVLNYWPMQKSQQKRTRLLFSLT
ncbi:hypothetical protein JHK84_050321 [Glycine max]|nr:hypothetical protein JHK86_050259 [Glycine max]KAG5094733.1 hypothetical protein JHK84_050321 [Glycine max]